MQRLEKFNHGVSTLPKKINQKLVDECKVKLFERGIRIYMQKKRKAVADWTLKQSEGRLKS